MARPFLLTLMLASAFTSVTGDSPIRLVNGNNVCSGRVEILYNHTWGTLCNDSWDMNDAAVVCRQLGCGSAISAYQSARFGQGSGQIWLEDVECSGSELSLSQCSHQPFGQHNCNHSEDAGVVCEQGMRLLNGSDSCCGRVEILHNGTWGSVCDDSWDMNDAAVVCRQLGCGSAISTPQNAAFGRSNGSIWLDDVRCSGSEESLKQCLHNGLGTYNCSQGEVAAVVCSGDLQKPNLSLISTHSVVSPGENVQFRCTTPTPRCNANAEFQISINGSYKSSQTHQSTVTFSLVNVDVSHQGTYSCQYSFRSGVIKSPLSNTVYITVVHLQQPSISHSAPDGGFDVGLQGAVITWGHSFTIICSIKSQHTGGSFNLSRGSNITRTQSADRHSASFTFTEVDCLHKGNYTCVYEVSVSSRTFNSSASEPLLITITVHLQQPNISPSASDGGFDVGLQGPVITRGHSFTIICSTHSQHPRGTFELFRGSNIISAKLANRHSASFTFPESDYSHEGNYTCVYEVSVCSRTFRSSASEPLLITITASLLPVIGAVVSALLLLLSALIIILLLKRRQKQRNKEGNSCEDPSYGNRKEVDDDEIDYENVELNENVDHSDSDEDYEKVDTSESGEDYEEVDKGDSREDYEEVDRDDYEEVDTDDSGEDYVNVNVTGNKSEVDKSDDL